MIATKYIQAEWLPEFFFFFFFFLHISSIPFFVALLGQHHPIITSHFIRVNLTPPPTREAHETQQSPFAKS
jgi:hypothetical protein